MYSIRAMSKSQHTKKANECIKKKASGEQHGTVTITTAIKMKNKELTNGNNTAQHSRRKQNEFGRLVTTNNETAHNNDTSHAQCYLSLFLYLFPVTMDSCELFILWIYIRKNKSIQFWWHIWLNEMKWRQHIGWLFENKNVMNQNTVGIVYINGNNGNPAPSKEIVYTLPLLVSVRWVRMSDIA